MKRIYISFVFILAFFTSTASFAQSDTTVYLITCSPGNEVYSLWGHSALRIVINSSGYDKVYNWGVFDFDTPNFAWKFSRGRLNYKLGIYGYNAFIRDYYLEQRSVISQVVNMMPVEKLRLMVLLENNARPENMYYRYDFLYDNCSSRIRDIFERIYGDKIIYPPDEPDRAPTFREKFNEYTRGHPWLKMGIDFLVGTPADKKTTVRDRMFLPDDLHKILTRAIVNHNRKMIPLLQPSETILDMPSATVGSSFFVSPIFVLSILFLLILFLSARFSHTVVINYIDIALFLVFSVLAILMIFFNFFTDHIETRLNLNIIWFNPFIILCLVSLARGRDDHLWFKITFFASLLYVPILVLQPDLLNPSFIPVIMILILRSSARSGYSWNPFTTEQP